MAKKPKFIISGYHQFSDGTEVVEIPHIFNSREAAAVEVSNVVNETISECSGDYEKVCADDCMDGYRFESDSDEVLKLTIVEVK